MSVGLVSLQNVLKFVPILALMLNQEVSVSLLFVRAYAYLTLPSRFALFLFPFCLPFVTTSLICS